MTIIKPLLLFIDIESPGIIGSGWKLVRHVPFGKRWHPAKDQLKGTDVYGVPSGPLSDQAWSVRFDNLTFNQFLFMTGESFLVWRIFCFVFQGNDFK